MAEQEYNAKEFALSLGFGEADAETLRNADATNIRRIAVSQGLLRVPKKKETAADKKARLKAEKEADAERAAAEAEAKAQAEEDERIAAEAEAAEAEANSRPTYEGQDSPPPELSEEELAAQAADVGTEPLPPE